MERRRTQLTWLTGLNKYRSIYSFKSLSRMTTNMTELYIYVYIYYYELLLITFKVQLWNVKFLLNIKTVYQTHVPLTKHDKWPWWNLSLKRKYLLVHVFILRTYRIAYWSGPIVSRIVSSRVLSYQDLSYQDLSYRVIDITLACKYPRVEIACKYEFLWFGGKLQAISTRGFN